MTAADVPDQAVSAAGAIPADPGQGCAYHENNRPCRELAAWIVRMDGRRLGLCDRHSRPEFHPPDLHRQLPGRVRRAIGEMRLG